MWRAGPVLVSCHRLNGGHCIVRGRVARKEPCHWTLSTNSYFTIQRVGAKMMMMMIFGVSKHDAR